jgi:predicted acylesterase/phospholipase RssA
VQLRAFEAKDEAAVTGRALVLGGGGITGIAWELGILAGLHETGVDLTGADLVVGTSAGSAVGAQITSGTPLEDLFTRQLRPVGDEVAMRLSKRTIARMIWSVFNEDDLNQQQRLKCAFDPAQILNPGKVFPKLHRCAELGRLLAQLGQVRFPDLPRF